jgi:UDPglucose 6-dehydrogenase
MNICVIGTGYVGLVTGVVFSDLGNTVTCVDKDSDKIQRLNQGLMPIYEPGLEEMVDRNVADERLTFTTDLQSAVAAAEVVFIAVGTPPREDGSTDLTFVESAAQGIARALNRYKVIVNKSTVPVGTGDFVREVIQANRRRHVDFDVVSNPEFLREGSAIADTLCPDRIVIGAPSQVVALKLLELYAPLERPMIVTDVASAEMIKYASNAFLAAKISFANSVAQICEAAGADVTAVCKGMGLDARIGGAFLSAGLGYGGSCFPKDTRSFQHTAQALGCEFPLLSATITTNEAQTPRFLSKVHQALGGTDLSGKPDLSGKTVGVLGLAFKPNTDDLREAKSLEVISDLLACGARVRAYDPVAMEGARSLYPQVEYGANAYEAATGAEALLVVTEWNEFKTLDLERLRSVMAQPLVLDGRNLWDPERLRRHGFEYHSVGRPTVFPATGPGQPNVTRALPDSLAIHDLLGYSGIH